MTLAFPLTFPSARAVSLLVATALGSVAVGCGTSSKPVDDGTPPPAVPVDDACAEGGAPPTCPGQPAPAWSLKDVQPASPRHEETYGLDAFVGSATYVVLLAGWCGYCQSQAAKLEEMRKELTDAGKKFTMVAINSGDAAGEQTNLTSRCSFPVFQDTPERTAWTAHGGGKDDMFFYGADGRLRTFLRAGGKINTNLSMPEGYDNVKKLLLEAIGQ